MLNEPWYIFSNDYHYLSKFEVWQGSIMPPVQLKFMAVWKNADPQKQTFALEGRRSSRLPRILINIQQFKSES